MKHRCYIFLLALATTSPAAATEAPTHGWYSIAIEVRDLPEGAQGVPVAKLIDFSQVLHDAQIPGTVDAKSLRLFRLAAGGDMV